MILFRPGHSIITVKTLNEQYTDLSIITLISYLLIPIFLPRMIDFAVSREFVVVE